MAYKWFKVAASCHVPEGFIDSGWHHDTFYVRLNETEVPATPKELRQVVGNAVNKWLQDTEVDKVDRKGAKIEEIDGTSVPQNVPYANVMDSTGEYLGLKFEI